MSSIWDYPTGIAAPVRNLVGYDVEATDGHIGKVDEASVVSGQAHLVVDTGSWIFGKKRMIPGGGGRGRQSPQRQGSHLALEGPGEVRAGLRRAPA